MPDLLVVLNALHRLNSQRTLHLDNLILVSDATDCLGQCNSLSLVFLVCTMPVTLIEAMQYVHSSHLGGNQQRSGAAEHGEVRIGRPTAL